VSFNCVRSTDSIRQGCWHWWPKTPIEEWTENRCMMATVSMATVSKFPQCKISTSYTFKGIRHKHCLTTWKIWHSISIYLIVWNDYTTAHDRIIPTYFQWLESQLHYECQDKQWENILDLIPDLVTAKRAMSVTPASQDQKGYNKNSVENKQHDIMLHTQQYT
jgi:hypothetical protein